MAAMPDNKAREWRENMRKVCDRLNERCESICQPSEPFDGRWQREWNELRVDLSAIEALLRTRIDGW
jgi:hypothetical protein